MPVYRPAIRGVSLSTAYAQAMAIAPTYRATLYTIEFLHSALDSPIRVVLNTEDVNATLEPDAPRDGGQEVTFKALPLGIQLPPESDQAQAPMVQLWIDGVSSLLAEGLEPVIQSLEGVDMIVRVYMSDDLSGPAQLPPLKQRLREIIITQDRVTVTASYKDPANRQFPGKTFTRAEYPGLSR
jgi:Domain of unknown function (DUF1833)